MKDRCSVYEIDVITRPNELSIAMNISKLKLLWGFCIMGAKSRIPSYLHAKAVCSLPAC